VALCGVTLVAGCGNTTGSDGEIVSSPDVWSEPDWQARYDWGQQPLVEACQTPTNRLLHLAPWPGLGLGMIVEKAGNALDSPSDILEEWFQLSGTWGATIPLEIHPTTIGQSYALVMLADPAILDAPTRSAVAEFVASQPPTTKLALYMSCAAATQIAGFGTDRDLLESQLTDGELSCGEVDGNNLWENVATVVMEAERIGGGALPALRTVVIVGGDSMAPPEEIEFAGSPVSIFWMAEGKGECPFPLVALSTMEEISLRLAAQQDGVFALGACTGMDADEEVTLTSGDGAHCPFPLPEGPGELEATECDALSIAALERDFPRTVELLFTPEEKEIYLALDADPHHDEFDLQIKLGDAPPVSATAHLRGQTSLGCVRKSYNVNLKGNRPRHILPGSATDEFYLLSMCKDDRYFQQYTANLLARPLGLFPLQFGFVELFLDGETRGVYLLLEKTKEALLEDNSRVHSIIRRRFDPGEAPSEVKYPSDGTINGPAGEAFLALPQVGEELAGEALLAEMNRLMNFDQFLLNLAFQTLMGNGDYVDEMIFYSTEAVREGEVREWFRLMAWDMDDLFSACHHSGKHAMEDPHEVLYCAEGNIEKAVMTDPAVYARFIELLEELINEKLAAEHLNAALEETAAELLPFFDDPKLCSAMTVLVQNNPEAVEPEVAKADIEEHMDTLRGQYAARRDKLVARIQAYHDTQDSP